MFKLRLKELFISFLNISKPERVNLLSTDRKFFFNAGLQLFMMYI